MSNITLYGRRGWGSAIVEAQLEWLGLDYTYEAVDDLLKSAEARRSLSPVNPLAQVPTLVLQNGQILTESAAITLYLADMTGSEEFVPPPGSVERPDFLRWLIFLVANVYPTYTYADETRSLCAGRGGEGRLPRRGRCLCAGALRHPRGDGARTLVSRRTLLCPHIYVAVMTRWRPRRQWFAENAPQIHSIATRADALPQLQAVWSRNFSEPGS